MKVFSSADSRRRTVLALAGILLALGGLYVALRTYAPFVFEAEELEAWIDGFGVLAPLVFVVVQTLQVIFAPVPGQVVAVVGGYLFGPLWGTVYSMTGVMIGSAVAFSIAKRYGRPAVERMIHEDVLARFDGFVERAGLPGLFLFVVIPGLPDDAVCFLAGLTNIGLVLFLVVMTVGRFPAYAATNVAGGSLASGRAVEAAVVLGVVVFASLVAYHQRERIQSFVRGR